MSIKTNTKEQIVAFKDFRLNAGKYLDALAKGQSFLVIKRSRPVFRMEPVSDVWETIDLTDKKGKGIPAGKFLKILLKNKPKV